MEGTECIGIMVFGYLIGSIPVGLLLTRRYSSADVLTSGSGNIGATNVRRVAGNRLGVMTLLLDIAKGVVPVYLAGWGGADMGGLRDAGIMGAGLASVIGHMYPIYMKFQNGGKGVATAGGCFLVLSPKLAAVSILIYLAGVLVSRRSSVGSLSAAFSLPVLAWFFDLSGVFIVGAFLLSVLILNRHRDNIDRLRRGTEPPLW
jgi:glycerol-3-phosphate acyltransferase PlsY